LPQLCGVWIHKAARKNDCRYKMPLQCYVYAPCCTEHLPVATDAARTGNMGPKRVCGVVCVRKRRLRSLQHKTSRDTVAARPLLKSQKRQQELDIFARRFLLDMPAGYHQPHREHTLARFSPASCSSVCRQRRQRKRAAVKLLRSRHIHNICPAVSLGDLKFLRAPCPVNAFAALDGGPLAHATKVHDRVRHRFGHNPAPKIRCGWVFSPLRQVRQCSDTTLVQDIWKVGSIRPEKVGRVLGYSTNTFSE